MNPQKLPANKTYISFAYEEDVRQAYCFYCARYKDMTMNEFMKIGIEEFMIKLNSIPESEPIFNILKSRIINIGQIKDKDEKKYWREMRRVNAIPDIYIPDEEINKEIEKGMTKYGKDIKGSNEKGQ